MRTSFEKIIQRGLIFVTFFSFFAKIYAGDTPCSATVIPNNSGSFGAYSINATGTSGGVGKPFCGNYIANSGECWLQFTAPASGFVTLETIAGTSGNVAIALYKTPCTTPSLESCFENSDCGANEMPNVTLVNLTANQIYLIRIWKEGGGSGTFQLRLSDPRQPLSTLGSATNNNPSPGCTRISLPVVSQRGCAWHPRDVDFTYPFERQIDMFFGTRNANGADGMAIVFQPNGLNICGQQGEALGAAGIPKCIIIELDTWNNNTPYEIPQDHIAVTINGITNSAASPPLAGPGALPNLEDGQLHKVKINWTAATKVLQVRVDGVLYVDFVYDFVTNVFLGDPTVTWGVTGSTGGSYNNQYFCYSDTILANTSSYTVRLDTVICEGQSLFAGGSWQTQAGVFNDLLQKTTANCDSTRITNLQINPKTYQFIDTLICEGDTVIFGNKKYFSITAGIDTIKILNGRGCDSILTVRVRVISLAATIEKPDTITCLLPQIALQGTDNTLLSNNNSYQWTASGGGNIIANGTSLTPTVDKAGIYQLQITYNDGIRVCTNTSPFSVVVEENFVNPDAQIVTPSDTINCKKALVKLYGSGGNLPNLSYQWTTINGHFVTGNNTPSPTVDSAGKYSLVVVNPQNGCIDSTDIVVLKNTTYPIAQIATPPLPITCNRLTTDLNAVGSSNGIDYSLLWTTSNGNILTGATTLTPSINQPGQYFLKVLNLTNGCETTVNATVGIDTVAPKIKVNPVALLTCASPTAQLNAEQSNLPAANFRWTAGAGNTTVISNLPTATVSQKGIYYVEATNSINGCFAILAVTVAEDTIKPSAQAGNSTELNCKKTEATLSASGSSVGTNFTYSWTTINGQISAGAATFNPKVVAAGTYFLKVKNEQNGCEKTDSVQVLRIVPQNMLLEIAQPPCFGDKGSIEVTAVQGGKPPFSYQISNNNNVTPDPFFANLSQGSYTITLRDANDCQLTQTAQIDSAVAIQMQLVRDWSILLGESVALDISVNLPLEKIASIVWKPALDSTSTDLLRPVLMPNTTTDYLLTLTDTNGCSVKDRLRIVVDKRAKVFIPNIINTNSANDENKIFYIFAKENSVRKITRFQIFDRWGALVFAVSNGQPNDPKFGWDGSHQGKIMGGVYVYFAEIELADGRTELFKGDVTVLKE